MRKLIVTLLAALAMMLSALTVTGPAQAATQGATSSDDSSAGASAGTVTVDEPSQEPTSEPTSEPTDEEKAALDKAAAEKAASEKAAKEKAAKKAKAKKERAAKLKAKKEKARKKRLAKKRAAKRAKERREMRVWNRLAHCESTSRWFIDTGNGYYGGLQISPGTWNAYGGRQFAGLPHRASKKQQVKVGKRIKNGQGWGAWPSCSRQLGLR